MFRIQIEPVKEVQEIMQEYEDIIQTLQYLLNNNNNYYYYIQEIIKKLEQNKKSIIHNLQTKDKNNEILKQKLTSKENEVIIQKNRTNFKAFLHDNAAHSTVFSRFSPEHPGLFCMD